MISLQQILNVRLVSTIPAKALEWRNDPQIRQWCRQYSLISAAQQEAWLNKIETDPSIQMFCIQDSSGTDTGVCGLTSIDRVNQKAEISHYIAPKYQAQKNAEASLLLLMHHAFQDQNLNRLWAEVFDGNPIMEILQSLQFNHEGTLGQSYFRDGEFIDSHIWAMNRSKFHECYSDRLGYGHKRTGSDYQPDAGSRKPDDSKSNAEGPYRAIDEAFRAIEDDTDRLRTITHPLSIGCSYIGA